MIVLFVNVARAANVSVATVRFAGETMIFDKRLIRSAKSWLIKNWKLVAVVVAGALVVKICL